MNLSFSTRGWQSCGWEQDIATAVTMRFGGIELYNAQREESLTGRGGPLHKYNTAATVRQLREQGLKIPCLDTSCDLSQGESLQEILAAMEIARNIQCP